MLKMKLKAATIVEMLVRLLTVFARSNIRKKMLNTAASANRRS